MIQSTATVVDAAGAASLRKIYVVVLLQELLRVMDSRPFITLVLPRLKPPARRKLQALRQQILSSSTQTCHSAGSGGLVAQQQRHEAADMLCTELLTAVRLYPELALIPMLDQALRRARAVVAITSAPARRSDTASLRLRRRIVIEAAPYDPAALALMWLCHSRGIPCLAALSAPPRPRPATRLRRFCVRIVVDADDSCGAVPNTLAVFHRVTAAFEGCVSAFLPAETYWATTGSLASGPAAACMRWRQAMALADAHLREPLLALIEVAEDRAVWEGDADTFVERPGSPQAGLLDTTTASLHDFAERLHALRQAPLPELTSATVPPRHMRRATAASLERLDGGTASALGVDRKTSPTQQLRRDHLLPQTWSSRRGSRGAVSSLELLVASWLFVWVVHRHGTHRALSTTPADAVNVTGATIICPGSRRRGALGRALRGAAAEALRQGSFCVWSPGWNGWARQPWHLPTETAQPPRSASHGADDVHVLLMPPHEDDPTTVVRGGELTGVVATYAVDPVAMRRATEDFAALARAEVRDTSLPSLWAVLLEDYWVAGNDQCGGDSFPYFVLLDAARRCAAAMQSMARAKL